MASATLALQNAITTTLTTNPPLLALLGSARVFDHTPNPPPYPYVTLGQTTARDNDSDIAPSDEHTVTLQVWSRARGRAETHAIIDAIRDALHDQPLTLAGHKLINLRSDFSEARRDTDGVTFRGIARFRAVTEPLVTSP
jgi:hypothetical protein